MAIYAIGDVQGCLPELQRLLDRLRFDPAADKLWFCGDLVNRGGQSLEVLRLIHSLRDSSVITLGNHDLSLLAVAERPREAQERVNPELRQVLFAEDSATLLEWLRRQKLLHHDEKLGWIMV
ncbi:MAG TPA: metallophosphoesterase, partial [Oleiagrimonas sp.]|nr:metallophosphoesterase [Oleiagrimonas sp.]